MSSNTEEKWILARAEYREVCAVFQSVQRSMPKDKRKRNAAQIVQLELAKQQLSNAAKKLREEEIEYKSSGSSLPPALKPVSDMVGLEHLRFKVPTKESKHMGTLENEIMKGIKLANALKPGKPLSYEEQMQKMREELKPAEAEVENEPE